VIAAILAASLLAPSGVTATIQGDPVCVPVAVQPGHSYPLSVWVSGSGPLALSVVPDTGGLHASLRQVPPSWVSFSANPASPGTVAFTLNVAPDAAPGAYWSEIRAAPGAAAQPGAGTRVTNRTAATTGIVFTVGPSSVPPPPCDALDLAQSTGKFPAWPTPAFRTTSWKQVFARLKGGPLTPDGGPTASVPAPDFPAVPAVTYNPAASAGKGSPKVPAGWLVLAGLALAVVAWRRKRTRS
jgi:hypothetical protein